MRTAKFRWAPGAGQLILKIPRISLESHLSTLLGRPVTEVVGFALRWGLFHHSRFAQQYRDLFNELPPVTLQR